MSIVTERLDSTKYHRFEDLGGEGSLYWQIGLYRNVFFYDSGSTNIEGLWLTTSKREKYQSQ